LKACEAQVPNYKAELNQATYMADDYVDEDYVERLF